MMKKHFVRNGLIYTTHLQNLLLQGDYLKTYEQDDDELVITIMDYVFLTTPDPYGCYNARHCLFPGGERGLFDSLEDWQPHIHPTVTLETLRVRYSRWKKTVEKRFRFLCERFKSDMIIPTGKGDPIPDPENDE